MTKGYRVEYQDLGKRFTRRRKHKPTGLVLLLSVLTLCGTLFIPAVRMSVMRHWNHARQSLTWTAIEAFSDDLKEGEDVALALDSFCRKVIKGE